MQTSNETSVPYTYQLYLGGLNLGIPTGPCPVAGVGKGEREQYGDCADGCHAEEPVPDSTAPRAAAEDTSASGEADAEGSGARATAVQARASNFEVRQPSETSEPGGVECTPPAAGLLRRAGEDGQGEGGDDFAECVFECGQTQASSGTTT